MSIYTEYDTTLYKAMLLKIYEISDQLV